MSFSSLIFIALFLPVFMIGSVFVRGNQRKNLLLLLFSLVFYAFAGLSNLALLLVMTTIAWFIGQRIGRALRFAASENPDYQEGDDVFQSPDAERTRVEGQKRARAWLLLALGHLYTLIVVFFGWVLFRFSDFQVLCEVLRTMFFVSGRATVDAAELLTLRSNLFFLIFSIIACTPLGARLAAKLRGFYDARLQQEAREKQQLEREKARYLKETEIDQQVQRLDASIEGLEEEDAENHERVANRLKRRITKSSEARRRSEGLYYGLRILLMLLLLAVSIVSMVGASYTPFLYNQF